MCRFINPAQWIQSSRPGETQQQQGENWAEFWQMFVFVQKVGGLLVSPSRPHFPPARTALLRGSQVNVEQTVISY